MPNDVSRLIKDKLRALPTAGLAQLPTPMHPLKNFSTLLEGVDLWIKRDDLTGLEGGGNKNKEARLFGRRCPKAGCRHVGDCRGNPIQSHPSDGCGSCKK